MNNSPQQPSAWQRFIQFPVTRIVVGIFMILVSVLITQLLVTAPPFSPLAKNILLGIFTIPVAYWTYYAYIHYIERRSVSELSFTGSFKELGQGILIGFLLFTGTIAILALLGVYKIVGTNSLDVILIPLIGAVISGFFEEILFR